LAKVIVSSLSDYTHAQLVTVDHDAFVADEPEDEGGDSLGPTPYELLAAALGTCTAMTLQIYARRKGYPLVEVAVEVEHSRTHSKDCRQCEHPQAGLIENLHRRMVFRGPLSEEQRDDLVRVAQRCPVHKTLRASPAVHDSVEVVS
jgi:putative redox protein